MREYKVDDKVEVLNPFTGKWWPGKVVDVREACGADSRVIFVTIAGDPPSISNRSRFHYFYEDATTGLRHRPKQYQTLKAQDLRPGTKGEYSRRAGMSWYPFEVIEITDDGDIRNRYCMDGTRWYQDGNFGTVKEANDHYIFRQEVNQ